MTQKQQQAEQLFTEGETIVAIAQKLGVSRRTIERWANEGAWREKRGNVVSIAAARDRHSDDSDDFDYLELVDRCLSRIAEISESSEVDARSSAPLATALVKLLELRLKLKPRSVTELIEMAIDTGITPSELVAELRKAWAQRAQ